MKINPINSKNHSKFHNQQSAFDESNLLSVENLKVYFHGRDSIARAVDGVDYNVRKGETVCLVGESGSGKTVSALAIMGLLPTPPAQVENGTIFFQGQNLLELSDNDMLNIRGKRIAMVFQEPMTSLNPVFKIGDQIGEALKTHTSMDQETIYQHSIELLDDVGIPSPERRVNDYPHQLSGGQRQRVMIAMALACGPDLIIADEPTTALDVTVQAQILSLFNDLKAKKDMSILYITHDLGVVAEIADRIYVMYSGIIVEEGQRRDLFKNPSHPYTRGLLASLPDRRHRGNKLYSIQGSVPDPANKPDGCPFAPRCEHAINTCHTTFPPMCGYDENHSSRCPVLFGSWK